MTEDAFLQTIRENPDDDGPRLVYADWLEERGDPRGEFIRVQCELARMEQDGEVPHLNDLQKREYELLSAFRAEWLGPMARFADWLNLTPVFHRGFVERINIVAQLFLGEFEAIAEAFPALRSAVLYNVAENIEGLARCPLLSRLSELGIADWIYYSEARSLSNCRHLVDLESIWLWVREYGQAQEAGFALIDAPSLEDVTLMHLYDGTHDETSPDDETRWRRRVEDELNERVLADRGAIFHVASASNRFFQVWHDPDLGVLAGKLADRQGIAVVDRDDILHVVAFDDDGKRLGHEGRSVRHILPRFISEHERNRRNKLLLPYMESEFGFKPGHARVREFVDPCGLAVHRFPSAIWDRIENGGDDTVVDFNTFGARAIQEWMESGRFVLDWGGEKHLSDHEDLYPM